MHSSRKSSEKKFIVVSPEAANQVPYPYVFVEDDGSVRELRPDEKSYLETPFLPMDGARPAIKESYESKNGWGSVRGFCRRSFIPEGIEILQNKAKSDPASALEQPAENRSGPESESSDPGNRSGDSELP